MNAKLFYLFARRAGANGSVTEGVFFKTAREDVAENLCGLFKKEYGDADGGTEFRYAAAAGIPLQEQVLMEESLDWLQAHEDPDPGIYEARPSDETLLLAQYGVRARGWEELLWERTGRPEVAGGGKAPGGASREPLAGAGAGDMPEEDRRNAMLGLLMLFAQAYYRMLESAVSMASTVSALDLELNHSYLWAVKNLRNLLANSPELKDFPEQFKPAVPNLYPSTIRDMDWEDGIGPEAEAFLSAVQDYVMEKGIYDPEKGSPAWCMVELFRPGVEKSVQRAGAYHERMSAAWRKMLGRAEQGASGGEGAGASEAQPAAPDPATGATAASAPAPASPDFDHGRLRCSADFNDVWVKDGGERKHYDLRKRTQARRCIQYLVESGAFDVGSALDLDEKIDPFVGALRRQKDRLSRVKIHDYFNGRNGELQELREAVIGSVEGSRRYFLKVE